MPILAVDLVAGTFDHSCQRCNSVRVGLRLDPAAGDLTPFDATGEALVVRVCPMCAGEQRPTTEILRGVIEAHEAGEAAHPGSLVGTVLANTAITRAVVSEHTHGYSLDPFHVQQAHFIRQMQRHPKVAAVAPLAEHRTQSPHHP